MNTQQLFPAGRFAHLLNHFSPKQILDFGLSETSLIETTKEFANYLGVGRCFLKLETELPTGTMKDRITELTFSRFKAENVSEYAHASTGNTAASLVWGMSQYREPFQAHLFIAGSQLPYHNFEKPKGMRVLVLQGASYDQSVKYAAWYTKHVLKDTRELGGATSSFRHEASKLSYLEALWQLCSIRVSVDVVCQSISAGVGIIGADKAINDALTSQWLKNYPQIVVAQPVHANPITACYQSGAYSYDPQFSIKNPKKSLAWPIRRGDASGTYHLIRDILDKSKGLALDANEDEISKAKHALLSIEGIDAGYASSVVMAALHSRSSNNNLRQKTALIMVTGKDRPRDIVTHVDSYISKEEWSSVLQ